MRRRVLPNTGVTHGTSKRRAPGFSLNFSKKDDRCLARSWHCHSLLDGNLHHKSFFMGSFTLNPKIPFPFILLFGEKNEPRRAAAGYRALSLGRQHLARGLRNSLCSHSPRPLSALGCRPLGPITTATPFPLFVCLCMFPFCSLLTGFFDSNTEAGMIKKKAECAAAVFLAHGFPTRENP